MLGSDDKLYLNNLAREAGAAIMNIFDSADFAVEIKGDDSPLTKADTASHRIIVPALKKRFPSIPVISEEDNSSVPFEERKDWSLFWLVDPLDGTKEFIKREKDFTVNIALIKDGEPLWGVVYAPARDWLYCGGTLEASRKEVPGEAPRTLPFADSPERNSIIAVRSKSHAKPEEETVLKKYGVTDTVSMGSSLKFCLVAEGTADLYFRAGPTWEWDTAAAHAVVLGADCAVYDGDVPLRYNKPSLKNDFGFLCLRNKLK